MKYFLAFLILLTGLTSCTTNDAPVVDGWKQGSADSSDYRVQEGDSIYSIGWAFGLDYREVARLNNLQEPYTLKEGQMLHLASNDKPFPSANSERGAEAPPPPVESMPLETPPPIIAEPEQHPVDGKPETCKAASPQAQPVAQPILGSQPVNNWLWPTQGKVIKGFSSVPGGNKGIDIAGEVGQPVIATATGKVVYTGASLPGYGNLIIIKHNDSDLSAYAFNKVIAVKEGQVVKAGQVIAQMGKNDSGKALLHFEIREKGKPIDPMPMLKHAKK